MWKYGKGEGKNEIAEILCLGSRELYIFARGEFKTNELVKY